MVVYLARSCITCCISSVVGRDNRMQLRKVRHAGTFTPQRGASSFGAYPRGGLPLSGVRPGLRTLGYQTQLYAPLPPPDQRQGRAFHPISVVRVGKRHPLQPFCGAHRHACVLDASLHLAPPHQGIKRLTPISRLAQSSHNLLTLHN